MIDKKVNEAIDVIKLASQMSEQYYNKPIEVAYSGGKDSDVLLDLAIKSHVDFRVIHNLTTADAPETMRHIKKKFKALKARGVEAEIKKNNKVVVNPIINWSHSNVWEYIRTNNKVARDVSGESKRDNLIDIAGYAACAEECEK